MGTGVICGRNFRVSREEDFYWRLAVIFFRALRGIMKKLVVYGYKKCGYYFFYSVYRFTLAICRNIFCYSLFSKVFLLHELKPYS